MSSRKSISIRPVDAAPGHRGRGSADNIAGRFTQWQREAVDDGWQPAAEPESAEPAETPPPETEVTPRRARSLINYIQSPDLPFDRTINPYAGCEHGCIYCYARPSHAFWDLSPGLDFETRLIAKENAVELLRSELAKPGYQPAPVALGANTDAYQPVERRLGLTRGIIEVLAECGHPYSVVTKSALIERDIDLMAPMAQANQILVWISLGTYDADVARRLEPRAAAPHRRLQTIRALTAAGIPVGVLVAPIIPGLTDRDLEHALTAAREAGATTAAYVMLRLPLEVAPLFEDWLHRHYPLRAQHVLSLVRQIRGGDRDGDGPLHDPRFGARMRGTGVFAELIRQRFRKTAERLGFGTAQPLDCSRFTRPRPAARGGQLELF